LGEVDDGGGGVTWRRAVGLSAVKHHITSVKSAGPESAQRKGATTPLKRNANTTAM
jgi:hypothetical protein